MTGPILLLICIILIALSLRMFQSSVRQANTNRVLERLGDGQPVAQ